MRLSRSTRSATLTAAAPQEAGVLGTAEAHLRRATVLDPAAAEAYNNLGTLLRYAHAVRRPGVPRSDATCSDAAPL